MIFLLLLLCTLKGFSQDLKYARFILDTLCSPAMHGRGYVQYGDKIASDFLVKEFENLGLKKISENYIQSFMVDVNTLPGELVVKLDKRVLRPGIDFLLDPSSPSIEGNFEIIALTEDDLLDEGKLIEVLKFSSGKIISISPAESSLNESQRKRADDVIGFLKYSPNHPASGIIIYTNDKLTWHGSTFQNARPIIVVQYDSKLSPRKIHLNIESELRNKYKTQNVLGLIEGTDFPDSVIVITAHYDHLGRMGKNTYFPGANDNASGVSIMLNIAKYYATNKIKPKYSILFIAFAAEEIGLLGSKFYTDNPILPLQKIKFLINLDISGTGDDGIQVVNGSIYKDKYDLMVKINEENKFLKEVKIRGSACNSDHCMFHQKDVPCFYIYTLGGIKAYHDIYDRAETLPFTEFENYFKLLIKFIDQLQLSSDN